MRRNSVSNNLVSGIGRNQTMHSLDSRGGDKYQSIVNLYQQHVVKKRRTYYQMIMKEVQRGRRQPSNANLLKLNPLAFNASLQRQMASNSQVKQPAGRRGSCMQEMVSPMRGSKDMNSSSLNPLSTLKNNLQGLTSGMALKRASQMESGGNRDLKEKRNSTVNKPMMGLGSAVMGGDGPQIDKSKASKGLPEPRKSASNMRRGSIKIFNSYDP